MDEERLRKAIKIEFPNASIYPIEKGLYKINTKERVITLRKWIYLMRLLKKYNYVVLEIVGYEDGTLGLVIGPIIYKIPE